MRLQERGKMSVVLVPPPFQGHMTPMLQLGSMLHLKGFSIILAYTAYNPPDPSKNPEFTHLQIPSDLPEVDTSVANLLNVVLTINNYCRQPFQNLLAQILDKEELYGRVTCIIYDSLLYYVDYVSNLLKLPTLILHTYGSAYLQVLQVILKLHAADSFPVPESELQEQIPGLYQLRYKDLPVAVTSKIPEELIRYLEIITDRKSSAAFIWNSTNSLEHSSLTLLQEQYQIPFFAIGPFHKMAPRAETSLLEEDAHCISWLDMQLPKSVLYVSLGSLATMDSKELIETAWALANSGQKFLWVVRAIQENESGWLKQLPEDFRKAIGDRGCIVKWAPQKRVLAHFAVGAFWTHCGWNSILESICEGVPMICRPHFGDQMVNAKIVTHIWRVGLELEDALHKGVIEATIRRVMISKEGLEFRQRAILLKEKLQLCVQEKGSSWKSLNDLSVFISSFSPQH